MALTNDASREELGFENAKALDRPNFALKVVDCGNDVVIPGVELKEGHGNGIS
jgi:hypothetical protein